MAKVMKPADISTQYYTKEFEKIHERIGKYFTNYSDFLLTLALYGFENENAVALTTKKGLETHNFSRTIYNRDSLEFDANFGLLTILTHSDKNYDKVLNSMAFDKNGDGRAYQSLINVNTFFSNLLGGIKPLNDSLDENEGLDSDEVLFDNLFELIDDTDEYTEETLNKLIEEENKI